MKDMVNIKIYNFFYKNIFKFWLIKDEDNKNFCFICQLNKYEYEKSGEIFSKHIEKEHNIWNYANFIIYMKNKTEKDCNGIESKIFKKIKSGDISWIPFANNGFFLIFFLFVFSNLSKKITR